MHKTSKSANVAVQIMEQDLTLIGPPHLITDLNTTRYEFK
jgi:hypothetical protein